MRTLNSPRRWKKWVDTPGIHLSCTLCGGTDLEYQMKKDGHACVRCRDCDKQIMELGPLFMALVFKS